MINKQIMEKALVGQPALLVVLSVRCRRTSKAFWIEAKVCSFLDTNQQKPLPSTGCTPSACLNAQVDEVSLTDGSSHQDIHMVAMAPSWPNEGLNAQSFESQKDVPSTSNVPVAKNSTPRSYAQATRSQSVPLHSFTEGFSSLPPPKHLRSISVVHITESVYSNEVEIFHSSNMLGNQVEICSSYSSVSGFGAVVYGFGRRKRMVWWYLGLDLV